MNPLVGSITGIIIGGSTGALARYGIVVLGVQLGCPQWAGVLAVNWLGCSAMGGLMAMFQRPEAILPPSLFQWLTPSVELALITGFLGAFTTFSAFAADIFKMLQAQQYALLVTYTLASVLGGLACLITAYRTVLAQP